MSAYLYDVCSAVWCLPTCVVCATVRCLPTLWCFPTRMIFSYLYDVSLAVWCLPICLMSPDLSDVRSTVWCTLACMMSTEIVQKTFFNLLQSFPNLSHPSLSTLLYSDSKWNFSCFFCFVKPAKFGETIVLFAFCRIWREKKFYVKNRNLTYFSLPRVFSVSPNYTKRNFAWSSVSRNDTKLNAYRRLQSHLIPVLYFL